MKKINVYILLFVTSLFVYSCTKDDGPTIEPLRDYSEQYTKDIDSINKFIDTHYMTVDTDYNVTFTEIPVGGTQESIRIQDDYPLEFRMVQNDVHNVNYKVYYIKLREGVNERPSAVDSVHASYRGVLTTTGDQFDFAELPVWFKLQEVVPGWGAIFPLFKTGTYDTAPGPNPVTYDGYGAGVMFLPSGLGYFGNSSPSGIIPAYSNLVFTFKLFELQYMDHDRDGIFSKDEVPYGSDIFYNPVDYDSDGDGLANMFDIDDDGDGVLTKREIRQSVDPITGAITNYPFASIPDCSGDTTTPTRIRRHLDNTCKPPY